jgi:hypothetical protein
VGRDYARRPIGREREPVRDRDNYGSDSGYSRSPPRSRGPSYTGPPSTDPRLSMYDGPTSIPDLERRSREEEFNTPDPYASNIPPPPYFLPPVLRQSSVYGSRPPPMTPYPNYLNGPRPYGPSYYDQYHAEIPAPLDLEAEEPIDRVQVDFSALQNVHNVSDKTAAALMPSIDAVTEVCGKVSKMLYLRTDDLQSRSGASTAEIESTAAELSGFAMVLSNAREVLSSTERLISQKAFENINTLLLFCKKALQKIRSVITTSRKVPSRLNFLRRDSLNSSLGKAKPVRLNLECVKTSLAAILSTINLANRQEELHRREISTIQNRTESSETLVNENGVHHDHELLPATYELDAAVERSTARLEDDILANSLAVTRWQQAERREFDELYMRGMAPISSAPISPASQWVSKLVPFHSPHSNLKRITGPEPFKAIGFGTEDVMASSSRSHIDEREEQARIAAVIRVLLAKWTDIPPQVPGTRNTTDKYVKEIPMTTAEVMMASETKEDNKEQTWSFSATAAEQASLNAESGIGTGNPDDKKTKHVSFAEASDHIIEDKSTHESVDSSELDLTKLAEKLDKGKQVEKPFDGEHADVAHDYDESLLPLRMHYPDKPLAPHPTSSSEVDSSHSQDGHPRADPAVLSGGEKERITKQEFLFLSEPDPSEHYEDDDEDNDIDGLPKAGWEHANTESTPAFSSIFPRPDLVPYSYPPPPGGYFSYPQSTHGPGSRDQRLPLAQDPYYGGSSASRSDRPPRSGTLFPATNGLRESRESGYAETMTSLYSAEPSRNSQASEIRPRWLEPDERERDEERWDYRHRGNQDRMGRERYFIPSYGASSQADRYRSNASYPRRTDSFAEQEHRDQHRAKITISHVRSRSPTESDNDSIISGPEVENTTKALVLSTNPFGAVVEQLTADLEAARRTIARKDELLINTPSLQKFESLEANVARLHRERAQSERRAEEKAAVSERTATENSEQIALLEASVATSTAKITTLEKRLSKRDATIERLKREKDERDADAIPGPPEPVPEPPEPPAAASLVEVVEEVVVVDKDAVRDAARRRRRSRSRSRRARQSRSRSRSRRARRSRSRSRSRRARRSRSVSEYSYYTFSNISKKSWTEDEVWEKVWTISVWFLVLVISVMMAACLATYLHSSNGAEIKKVLSVMDVNEDLVCSI